MKLTVTATSGFFLRPVAVALSLVPRVVTHAPRSLLWATPLAKTVRRTVFAALTRRATKLLYSAMPFCVSHIIIYNPDPKINPF